MKPLNARQHWIVDAVLFTGFMLAFWMDLTGLNLHQWLGVLVGVLTSYHLLVHWNWVKCMLRSFTQRLKARPLTCLVLDTILALSFVVMLVTGVVLSTWLNLALAHYEVWRVTHILSSIGSLGFLIIKLALHWRWIVTVARRYILPTRSEPAKAPVPSVDFARREFLGVMGVVGVASALAMLNASKALVRAADGTEFTLAQTQGSAPTPGASSATPTPRTSASAGAQAAPAVSGPVATATPTPPPTPLPTATPTPAQACVVRCPRGCSFPGRCRKYTDANGNGRCDWGECL